MKKLPNETYAALGDSPGVKEVLGCGMDAGKVLADNLNGVTLGEKPEHPYRPAPGRGVVLSLCDRTGNMVRPWLDAGYKAITVDLQDCSPERGRYHFVMDVANFRYPFKFGKPVCIFAFPPCTHLAVSGARWFKEKGIRSLINGLSTVEAVREICETLDAPYMIENPVGTLSTYWREPDYSFDPCDYGDPYTKKTCLWIGGGFVMPPKVRPGDMFSDATSVEPTLGSMIHQMPPSDDRGDLRSITPMGFARAVFEANAPHLATLRQAAE